MAPTLSHLTRLFILAGLLSFSLGGDGSADEEEQRAIWTIDFGETEVAYACAYEIGDTEAMLNAALRQIAVVEPYAYSSPTLSNTLALISAHAKAHGVLEFLEKYDEAFVHYVHAKYWFVRRTHSDKSKAGRTAKDFTEASLRRHLEKLTEKLYKVDGCKEARKTLKMIERDLTSREEEHDDHSR